MPDEPIKQDPNHICIYGTKVQEIYKIVCGNGDPDGSLIRRVAIIGERQGNVIDKLGETKESVDEILLKLAGLKGKEEAQKELEERTRIADTLHSTKIQNLVWRITTVIAISISAVGVSRSFTKINTVQENIQSEVKTNQEMISSPPGNATFYNVSVDSLNKKNGKH